MSDIEQVYKSPESDLFIEEPVPTSFKQGKFSKSKLQIAGWFSLFYIFLLVPVTWISVMSALQGDSYPYSAEALYLGAALTAVWIYLILVMKSLLNERFDFDLANKYINLQVMLSVPMAVLSIFMDNNGSDFGIISIVYFILLVAIGIVTILFGKQLLKISTRYSGLKLYAWTNIISGVCMASIILIFLAIPAGIVSSIAMAIMFFSAAKELCAE